MSLTPKLFTYFAAATICAITLISGLLPLYRRYSPRFYAWSEAGVSGLFLGAGLFHLLPDAVHSFHQALPIVSFPLPYTLCASSFIVLFLLDFAASHVRKPIPVQSYRTTASAIAEKTAVPPAYVTGCIVLLALSIHSILGGLAMGLNARFADTFIIFIAILAHKATDSFALFINLRRTHFSKTMIVLAMCIFAIMTPLGIIIAHVIAAYSTVHTLQLWSSFANALAAGTFIFIATLEGVGRQLLFAKKPPVHATAMLLIGLIIMALLAIWA